VQVRVFPAIALTLTSIARSTTCLVVNANNVFKTGTKTTMESAVCPTMTADAEMIKPVYKDFASSDLLTAESLIALAFVRTAQGIINLYMASASTKWHVEADSI
jgi:hypothetical protein